MTVLIICILLAVIWLLIKLLGFAVKLPFRILGFLFRKPGSVIFWVVIILLILLALA